jgi:hypothetical protein
MRDNHEGCLEILAAYERDGQYFGAVKVVCSDEVASLEFGVSQKGYFTLKRILACRPFSSMPGIQHRHFFCGDYRSALEPTPNIFKIGIRIEQNDRAKKFEFTGPKALLANLVWFMRLKSLEEASELRRLDGHGEVSAAREIETHR